jgi:phage baseplate assembly protein W
MVNVTEITNTDWQISTSALGNIAQGAADINQCLNIIFSSQKGTNPVRPEFGIDILKYIDRPGFIMAPELVSEIIDQIATYETRIDLSAVNYKIIEEKVIFSLVWAYKDGTLFNGAPTAAGNTITTYFLLADQDGFILLTDYDVSLIIS